MAGDLNLANVIVRRNATILEDERKFWCHDIEREHYVVSRKRDIARLTAETRDIETQSVAKHMKMYHDMMVKFAPNGLLDDRDKLAMRDMTRNMLRPGSALLLTEDKPLPGRREISIQTVASKLGIRYPQKQSGNIGKRMKRLFLQPEYFYS